MCSDPGQDMIINDIRNMGLNRVVVASCSPRLHEKTFRNACLRGGLNPYLFHMTCIREHCSWVTEDPDEATTKSHASGGRSRGQGSTITKNSSPARNMCIPDILVVGGGIAEHPGGARLRLVRTPRYTWWSAHLP